MFSSQRYHSFSGLLPVRPRVCATEEGSERRNEVREVTNFNSFLFTIYPPLRFQHRFYHIPRFTMRRENLLTFIHTEKSKYHPPTNQNLHWVILKKSQLLQQRHNLYSRMKPFHSLKPFTSIPIQSPSFKMLINFNPCLTPTS